MSAGRKRAFDKEEALDKAMRVFWAGGYSGTSLSDLTTALGINKPSLYAAFGNKEQLFKASVNHYMKDYGAPHWQKLIEPAEAPLKDRLRAYLNGIVDLISSAESPQGCLFVRSTCESGAQTMSEGITAMLQDMGQEHERALVGFLRKEKFRGNLPANIKVKELATYIMSVMYGLGVLVKNGNSRKSLRSVVDIALRAI